MSYGERADEKLRWRLRATTVETGNLMPSPVADESAQASSARCIELTPPIARVPVVVARLSYSGGWGLHVISSAHGRGPRRIYNFLESQLMSSENTAVFGIYKSAALAERAVDNLIAAG